MLIHNIRLGFANNSSSSHSLIFAKLPDNDLDPDYFGWNSFTAGSKESRTEYCAALLRMALREILESQTAADKLVAGMYPAASFKSVDHQSAYVIPSNFRGDYIHEGFYKDLEKFLLQDGLTILGGNDNGGEHPLAKDSFELVIPQDYNSADWVARKEKSKIYTLFSRKYGNRVTVDFNNPAKATKLKKSSRPMLVDVKITDYCPFNCPACYQGSTVAGKHAPIERISNLFYNLGELEVFEVALGGGEPTLHPNFVEILRRARYSNIVPNFTTKTLAWLKDDVKRAQILEKAGSFAYSIDHAGEFSQLAAAVLWYGIEPHRVSVQVIDSLIDPYSFAEVLRASSKSGIRVTLLGYKETERGATYKKYTQSTDWVKVVKKLQGEKVYFNLAVDTEIIQKYEKEIRDAGVPETLFHREEGKFSMYVDMVKNRIGPSSYCAEEDYVQNPRDDGYMASDWLENTYFKF